MNYMLMIYADRDAWAKLDSATMQQVFGDYGAYTGMLGHTGALVGGHQLQGPKTATTVRIESGERIVTDGPFADAKEHLGG